MSNTTGPEPAPAVHLRDVLWYSYALGADYMAEQASLNATLARHVPPENVLAYRGACPVAWLDGCAAKPGRLAKVLANPWPHEYLIYLDADARMSRAPTVEELAEVPPGGWACHWFRDRELISATLVFRAPFEASRGVAAAWAREMRRCPDEWDQRVLQRLVETQRVAPPTRLGPEWNWIDAAWPGHRFECGACGHAAVLGDDPRWPSCPECKSTAFNRRPDLSERHYGDRRGSAIIIQTQASRRLGKERT